MDPALRTQLRTEANAVKDCFTTFSFQALTLTAAALGLVLNFQSSQPLVGFASIPVIFVLLTVSRIGAHKYATANRHFGYELFCDTLATDQERRVGWETSMEAWRIVQATVFDRLFFTHNDFHPPNLLRFWILDNVQRVPDAKGRPWYDVQKTASSENSRYHAGSYLSMMHKTLHAAAILTLIPLWTAVFQLNARRQTVGVAGSRGIPWWLVLSVASILLVWLPDRVAMATTRVKLTASRKSAEADGSHAESPDDGRLNRRGVLIIVAITILLPVAVYLAVRVEWDRLTALVWIAAASATGFTMWVLLRIRQMKARRDMLEYGILSITSCAAMWKTVVGAHTRARTDTDPHYLKALARIASTIQVDDTGIRRWSHETHAREPWIGAS